MKRIEQYIKEELKDCPLTELQEEKLLVALDRYITNELESKQSSITAVVQAKPEVCDKCKQKHLIEQMMKDDEKDGLYDE
jgi:hypothetical protein